MSNKFDTNNFYYKDNNSATAYLLGIYLSDGYIYPNKYKLEVVQLDKEIPEKVQMASYKLFGKKPKISIKTKIYKGKPKKYWKTAVCSKSLCNWLTHETRNKQIIPDVVYNQTKEWKKLFISGLLDGDGWATFSQNRYETKSGKLPTWYCQIGLVGASDRYITGFPRLLDQLGVLYTINYVPPRKEGYKKQTRVLIKPTSFIEKGLYFNVSRKIKKVESFNSYLAMLND